MDILLPVGAVVALGMLIGGLYLDGGTIGQLVGLPAVLIVFGGCLGAMMIEYPLAKFIESLMMALKALMPAKNDPVDHIKKIVEFSNLVRKDGLLALEPKVKELKDPFFKRGLQLLVDGTDPKLLREILETDYAFHEEHTEANKKFYESAGGYLPTFGIIGAVMGLMQAMGYLDDPEKLGHAIATAFIATIYGLVGANVFCFPINKKLKLYGMAHGISMQLIIEGILSMADGVNPNIIQEKLEGFLDSAQKIALKKGTAKK